MNPAFVWRSARKDLVRRLRDPWSLVLALGMPLVISGLILLAFGGGSGRVPVARVLVVDHDSTLVSGLLVRSLDQSPTIVTEMFADTAAGRARIEDGKATALVVIPDGFGTGVIEGQPVRLGVLTHPGQRILPGIVTSMLALNADAGFYLQQLFGEELRVLAAGPAGDAPMFPEAQITGISADLNRKIGRIGGTLFPPQIEVTTRVDSTGAAADTNFGALFFPGILFMALLFMASGVASDVWIEKESGTLRRMIATPQRVRDFLAGKMLAGGLLMTATSLIALLVGVAGFGIRWESLPLALLWSGFAGTTFLILITLIQLHATSARTAGVFTSMLLFPALMIGGSFFPFESMPAFLARIGRLTPNGWALEQFKAILGGAVDGAALAAAFAALLAVAVVAFFLSAARMRRGFAGA
jgi:ABC-type multidrug transport system permease subunit